jgi:hypothetical protein
MEGSGVPPNHLKNDSSAKPAFAIHQQHPSEVEYAVSLIGSGAGGFARCQMIGQFMP